MKPGFDYTGLFAVFICHDGRGKFLMSKRGEKARDEQGKWEFGGGTIEFGELPEETVRRELLEEYNCRTIHDLQPLAPFSVIRTQEGQKTHWVGFSFVVHIDPKEINNNEKNYIVTWLPKLLRDKHHPVFTEQDYTKARHHNEDLDKAIETILKDRLRFKTIVLIDEENVGIKPTEQRFITELSEIIYPIAVDYSVFRVIADNARERTKIAQAIIKALLFVGPLAHILEKYSSGLGKLFAASADDLIGESAELMALRGSGFSWRELAKRGRILIPVFALATWGAFSVEGLIQTNRLVLAGIVFGFSAVALSLTTAIQSIFMYRKNALQLVKEKKLFPEPLLSVSKLAIIQDFTNPARLGLLIGALMAPIMGIIGAVLGLMHNGWILAGIGSTESIVAGLTVVSAGYVNEWRFRRKLTKML